MECDECGYPYKKSDSPEGINFCPQCWEEAEEMEMESISSSILDALC